MTSNYNLTHLEFVNLSTSDALKALSN
jgi:hypothetical protein